jgi:hypothetical protein
MGIVFPKLAALSEITLRRQGIIFALCSVCRLTVVGDNKGCMFRKQ